MNLCRGERAGTWWESSTGDAAEGASAVRERMKRVCAGIPAVKQYPGQAGRVGLSPSSPRSQG